MADIRLREGEVNILGGLELRFRTRTPVNGIPGLVNIPVLGKSYSAATHG